MLMMCTGRLYSPPRASKSETAWLHFQGVKVNKLRTFAHCVEASLLASDDDVGNTLAFVPPLRGELDPAVAVQHVKDAVGAVPAIGCKNGGLRTATGSSSQASVLAGKVLIHNVVRGTKRVDIGPIHRRSRKTDGRASASRDHLIPSFTAG
jgi:hypothetical protein